MPEYTLMVSHYLGKRTEIFAMILAFFYGLIIAILNFLLIVQYLFGAGISIYSLNNHDSTNKFRNNMTYFDDQTCVTHHENRTQNIFEHHENVSQSSDLEIQDQKWTFSSGWDMNSSIPFYCLVVYFILNFRKDTVFNRLSGIGAITNFILFVILIMKAWEWFTIEHLNFDDPNHHSFIPQFNAQGMIILSGYLQGAYNCHQNLITIVKDNKNRKNNNRDVILGMTVIVLTYIFVGLTFYLIYPGWKDCINDVFINNFARRELLMPILYLIMFVRCVLVYPLNLAGIRNQVFTTLYGETYPGLGHVLVYNAIMILFGLIFAIFYDKVGDIFRYGCSFCAMLYAYIFPFMCALVAERKDKGRISTFSMTLHLGLMAIGVTVFLAQFFVTAY